MRAVFKFRPTDVGLTKDKIKVVSIKSVLDGTDITYYPEWLHFFELGRGYYSMHIPEVPAPCLVILQLKAAPTIYAEVLATDFPWTSEEKGEIRNRLGIGGEIRPITGEDPSLAGDTSWYVWDGATIPINGGLDTMHPAEMLRAIYEKVIATASNGGAANNTTWGG